MTIRDGTYGNVPSLFALANLSLPPHLFTIFLHFIASFSKDALTFVDFIAYNGSNFEVSMVCLISAFHPRTNPPRFLPLPREFSSVEFKIVSSVISRVLDTHGRRPWILRIYSALNLFNLHFMPVSTKHAERDRC